MRVCTLCWLSAATLVVALPDSAAGHSLFANALKERYGLRSASCYTCHLHKDQTDDLTDEERAKFEEEPKQFYNDFGKLMPPLLKDKNVGQRIEEASETKKKARAAETEAEETGLKAKAEQIEAELTQDFLKAMDVVDAMVDKATGKTYGEKLKAGEVEGTKLPE